VSDGGFGSVPHVDAPVCSANVPGAHNAHCSVPFVALYEPRAHGSHLFAVMSKYSPGVQLWVAPPTSDANT